MQLESITWLIIVFLYKWGGTAVFYNREVGIDLNGTFNSALEYIEKDPSGDKYSLAKSYFCDFNHLPTLKFIEF